MGLRTRVRRAGRRSDGRSGAPRSACGRASWPAHSRLFVAQDGADWVLAYEARQLERSWRRALGVQVGPERWVNGVGDQSIFHQSQFTLLLHEFERHGNRLGFAYFHGRPGTPGFPEFDACFETLRRRHAEIDRVQVTNRAMEELVLETGVAAEKVHRIPIGIDVGGVSRCERPSARAARGASSTCRSPRSSSARSRRTASAGGRGSSRS